MKLAITSEVKQNLRSPVRKKTYLMALRLSTLARFTQQNSKNFQKLLKTKKIRFFANVRVLANFTPILRRDLINHINYSGFVKLVRRFSRIFSQLHAFLSKISTSKATPLQIQSSTKQCRTCFGDSLLLYLYQYKKESY